MHFEFDREETNDQESRAFHPRNETKKIASLDGKEGGEGGRKSL